jgi:hypothetical protein
VGDLEIAVALRSELGDGALLAAAAADLDRARASLAGAGTVAAG